MRNVFFLAIVMMVGCAESSEPALKVREVRLEGNKTPIILLKGNYYGNNIYVQNPFSSSGIGFCIDKISVNGDISTAEVSSSAVEVDLSNFNLEENAEVEIRIYHQEGCLPKILNPHALDYPTENVGNKVDSVMI